MDAWRLPPPHCIRGAQLGPRMGITFKNLWDLPRPRGLGRCESSWSVRTGTTGRADQRLSVLEKHGQCLAYGEGGPGTGLPRRTGW